MRPLFTPPLPAGLEDLINRRPPLEPLKWSITAMAVRDYFGTPIPGVTIRIADLSSGVTVASGQTDSGGTCQIQVAMNDAGYRVKPYLYGYAFCPGYYDAYGNTDVPPFVGRDYGKGDSK